MCLPLFCCHREDPRSLQSNDNQVPKPTSAFDQKSAHEKHLSQNEKIIQQLNAKREASKKISKDVRTGSISAKQHESMSKPVWDSPRAPFSQAIRLAPSAQLNLPNCPQSSSSNSSSAQSSSSSCSENDTDEINEGAILGIASPPFVPAPASRHPSHMLITPQKKSGRASASSNESTGEKVASRPGSCSINSNSQEVGPLQIKEVSPLQLFN